MAIVYSVLCFTVWISITVAQVEFRFENSAGYNAGDSAKLIAKYTGGGTEQTVNWYYSGRVSGDNIVNINNSCQLFVADAGYPPMTYTCNANTHTYTATITSVPSSAIGKEWGVSFSLSNGTTTAVVKDTLKQYTSSSTDDGGLSGGEIAGIVIGAIAVVAIVIAAIGVFIYKKMHNEDSKTICIDN